MIKYTITRIDEATRSIQIKYEKEGKPAYFVRTYVEGEFNSSNINYAADLDINVEQAITYWNNMPETNVVLTENTGFVKERITENKPDYDLATQKITMQTSEDSETKTKSWIIEELTSEELIAEIRNKRNALLFETDIEVVSDRNPSQEMLDYRQALRDLTDQEGFPTNITWPMRPID